MNLLRKAKEATDPCYAGSFWLAEQSNGLLFLVELRITNMGLGNGIPSPSIKGWLLSYSVRLVVNEDCPGNKRAISTRDGLDVDMKMAYIQTA